MSKINVCFSCDDNYAKYAGVALTSILYNAKEQDDLAIYILDGGISEENKINILSLKSIKECEINFIKIDNSLFDEYKIIKTHGYLPIVSFYRLKVSSLLPNLDKVIYFDCDFVICDSLKELFDVDLENNYIGAVNDIDKRKCRKNTSYINSGMIIFDLKKMREDNIEKLFYDWAVENQKIIKLGDQDVISYSLAQKIKLLDKKWNVQSSNFINRSTYTNHPKAIHMLNKPWKFASACMHKAEYFKYLQMTPWKMSKEDLHYWTVENEKASIKKYLKKKPLFFLRPHFYIALFWKYCLKDK